ncbi:rhomboid family protein [Verrucomicrobiota bacterium]
MSKIAQQRCFNHPGREAVARCPECERFFCRECITEHEDRVICAACLKTMAGQGRGKGRYSGVSLLTRCLLGFLVLWFVFFSVGRMLLRIPSSFHDGTLWRNLPWNNW